MHFSAVLSVRCVTEIWIPSMDAVVAGVLVSLQWAVVTVIDYFLFLRSNLCFLEICR